MSKKRNKNARKKVARKKALAAPRRPVPSAGPPELGPPELGAPSPVAPSWTPPQDDIEEPVQQVVDVKEGAGAIETFRMRLTPGAGRDGDTMLTKRRPLWELSLWLAAALGLIWLVWKLIQSLAPPI